MTIKEQERRKRLAAVRAVAPLAKRDKVTNEQLLRLADNIAAHGSSITYPSRCAAQEVRNVVRELAAALRDSQSKDRRVEEIEEGDDEKPAPENLPAVSRASQYSG